MRELVSINGELIGYQFRKTKPGRTVVRRKIRYYEHNGKRYPYIIWDKMKLLVARASEVYREQFKRYNLKDDWWVAICQVYTSENGDEWEVSIEEYESRLRSF